MVLGKGKPQQAAAIMSVVVPWHNIKRIINHSVRYSVFHA